MIRKRHSRREILKGAAALTAVASFGATVGRAAAPQSHAQIDAVLRRATEAGEVPASSPWRQPTKGHFTRERSARAISPRVRR